MTTMLNIGDAVLRTDKTLCVVNRGDNMQYLNKTNHVCLFYVTRIAGIDL